MGPEFGLWHGSHRSCPRHRWVLFQHCCSKPLSSGKATKPHFLWNLIGEWGWCQISLIQWLQNTLSEQQTASVLINCPLSFHTLLMLTKHERMTRGVKHCTADKGWTTQLNGQPCFNAICLLLLIRGGKGIIQIAFFFKQNGSRLFYYSVPCLFMVCYLRVADVYWVPMERGEVGDCCQVTVQQISTTHHMVPEDLSHHSLVNPVFDLQPKVGELQSRWASPKLQGQIIRIFWLSYLLVGHSLVCLCEVQTGWKGQGLQYLW